MYRHIKKRVHVEWGAGLKPLWGQWLDRFASWGVVSFVIALLRGGVSTPKVSIMVWLSVFLYSMPITTQGMETQLELNVEGNFCGTAYGVHSPRFRGLHTGQDYCNALDTEIKSLSFGKVAFRYDMIETPNCAGRRYPNACEGQPDHGMGNVLEIHYLLSNGKEITSSYNHLNRIDTLANQDGFIAKEQVVGYMGRSGQRSLNYYDDIHLHFEMKTTPRRLVDGGLESLFGYSRSKDENGQFIHPDNYGFLSPNDYLNTQSVLLPFLSRSGAIPSETSYDVFGYANKPLHGSLDISGDFYHATIIARNSSNRNDAENHNSSANPSRLGEEGTWNSTDLTNIDEVSGNTDDYQAGDYLFLASLYDVDSRRYGYPIVFSILEENSLIVDNDQLEQQTGEEREHTEFTAPSQYSSDLPGYFLSAGVVKGQSDKIAKWNPRRRGIFQVVVYIPAGATASSVRYKIVTKKDNGEKSIYVTNPINHNVSGWQPLSVTKDGKEIKHFFLKKNDYVSLHVNVNYVASDWGVDEDVDEIDTNKDITASQYVAIDAIKFKGGLQKDSDNFDDLTKIRTGLNITEDIARAVYRNYMTEAPNSIETSQDNETISVEHDSDNNLSRYTLNNSVITISWLDGTVEEDNVTSNNTDTGTNTGDNDTTSSDDSICSPVAGGCDWEKFSTWTPTAGRIWLEHEENESYILHSNFIWTKKDGFTENSPSYEQSIVLKNHDFLECRETVEKTYRIPSFLPPPLFGFDGSIDKKTIDCGQTSVTHNFEDGLGFYVDTRAQDDQEKDGRDFGFGILNAEDIVLHKEYSMNFLLKADNNSESSSRISFKPSLTHIASLDNTCVGKENLLWGIDVWASKQAINEFCLKSKGENYLGDPQACIFETPTGCLNVLQTGHSDGAVHATQAEFQKEKNSPILPWCIKGTNDNWADSSSEAMNNLDLHLEIPGKMKIDLLECEDVDWIVIEPSKNGIYRLSLDVPKGSDFDFFVYQAMDDSTLDLIVPLTEWKAANRANFQAGEKFTTSSGEEKDSFYDDTQEVMELQLLSDSKYYVKFVSNASWDGNHHGGWYGNFEATLLDANTDDNTDDTNTSDDSESVYDDCRALTVANIQSFLDTFNGQLKDESLKDRFELDPSGYSLRNSASNPNAENPFVLSEIQDDKAKDMSPAEIIFYSAKENSLNPVILLAKLQKEQNLITKSFSDEAQQYSLDRATGYKHTNSDPDGDPIYKGFFAQSVSMTFQYDISRNLGDSLREAYDSYTQTGDATLQEKSFAVFFDIYTKYVAMMNEIVPGVCSNNISPVGNDDTDDISPHQDVPPSITVHINEDNGNVQISGANLGANGTITIGENTVQYPGQGYWTDDGITLLKETLQHLDKSVKIKIVNTDGDEFNICYPFIDVCPDTWYTKPIMTLWKKDIVNGYGGDWEGYFRPHKPPASRAEFVTAVVRALENMGYYAIEPVTNDPFDDVDMDDWYAPYIKFAKDMGIVSGCGDNNFCPNNPITRAEAIKIISATFLSDTLDRFENGEQPPRIFLDVDDPSQWYYPYIYAAEVEDIVDGFKEGYFKPNQDLTRAEMAKVICSALATTDNSVDKSDCAEMGETTGRPYIFAVTPEIATLNESTVFTVVGRNLSNAITFELLDCANLTAIAGGTAEELLFQCTPSNTGGVKNGTLQYNEEHTVFTVNVSEQVVPKVTSVSPLTATLNQLTTFTVIGSDLPNSLIFEIANCTGINVIETGTERQQFQCTPTNEGSQESAVKDESGAKLKVFFVDVVTPVSEPPVDEPPVDEPPVDEPPVDEPPVDEPPVDDPPVDEPPVDEPSEPEPELHEITKVSPLSVQLGQSVVFTIRGINLTDNIIFWLDECENRDNGECGVEGDPPGNLPEKISTDPTMITFKCKPCHKTGLHEGKVKDGDITFPFTVDFYE